MTKLVLFSDQLKKENITKSWGLLKSIISTWI
ncbi:hypothetical protein J2Z22_004834 [Paenibacillus forsythiae]|uniref:Uncharacterized protein n=1 Tax=Paenibacillus forsythiae TaxID=365616 RepID=A0ABU3HEK7_9BACL|nr:hypothetical protein [Paenibacillus forsythiae]